MSWLAGRLVSIAHACRGLARMIGSEPNARIHFAATVVVVIAGLAFGLGRLEWALIAVAVTGVWVAEALNTAIEAWVDLVSPEVHPLAGKAKDIAAGGVLAAAIGSLVIAALVFGPRILQWLER